MTTVDLGHEYRLIGALKVGEVATRSVYADAQILFREKTNGTVVGHIPEHVAVSMMPMFVYVMMVVRGRHVRQWGGVDAMLFGIESQAVLVVGANGVSLLVNRPHATVGIVFERGVHVGTVCHQTRSVPSKTPLVSAYAVAHVHANVL